MSKLESAQNWKGAWTALITPFNHEKRLDLKSLETLIHRQISEGVTGLVIAGSTGEGSLIDNATYATLLKEALHLAEEKIPIVAGLGIGGTRETLEKASLAKKAGVNGFLACAPAYIKAPVRGLVTHFKKIAELEVPLCLYDVPSRSATPLSDDVIDFLLQDRTASSFIHALKDATGKPERITKKEMWKSKLALLSGDDESFPQFMEAGGHGIISVASHFALKEFKAVAKKEAGAKEKFEKILPFIRNIYSESNPLAPKSLAHKLGWISTDTFQEPLCPLKAELLDQLYGLYQSNFK